MLLQALGLAVNLSSETLSYETLKIAEMLKKRTGGVELGCNSLSRTSNTRKDMFIYLFSLPSSSPSSFHPVFNTSISSSFLHHCTLYFHFSQFVACLPFSLSVSLTLLCHLVTLTISPLPLPALLRPWGTIPLHRLTLV